ncbi:MAG: ATP-binding protein [Bacteroidetes bacterium]|uniref:ATP-binding protein n=1 Tax=Candidatus Cryptobacteroides merdavium TaxID=2840769 RepID=A0A9D9H7N5_9BACT|nr:ATP-binding protein [Candidatus Cryptobacteroides merdavium]
MEGYIHRIMDGLLAKKLQAKGAVVIEGPKWCGKTTTAEEIAASKVLLARTDMKEQFNSLLEIDTDAALSGETPMLIDEWQTVPKLWDAVRYTIDHRRKMGQFILTGSAVPDKEAEMAREHSGTGRFAWLTMRPMTLFESGESNGSVSLTALFSAPGKILEKNSLSLQDIAFLICRGGWPMSVGLPEEAALEQAFDYYDAVTKEDVTKADGVKRASERVQRLMRAYARHQGTQASIATLREDLKNNDTAILNDDTIASYLEVLRKIFVVEDMPAWNPNLRSKTAIRTADTRYFVDPSIATAALGLGPDDLMNDLNTMGFFFETMCVRDLRVFAEALNGKVYHYRDKSGLECDAVVHLRNGQYGLIEIKLGGQSLINDGVATLNALAGRIDTSRMKAPAFLMVLTATGEFAYRRPEDGVYVVPIGCLRP